MRMKIVRDKIKQGPTTVVRPTFTHEKLLGLCLKLHEEAAEIADDPTDMTEYADLLEVMQELARMNGVDWDDVLIAQEEKQRRVGGFRRGKLQAYVK